MPTVDGDEYAEVVALLQEFAAGDKDFFDYYETAVDGLNSGVPMKWDGLLCRLVDIKPSLSWPLKAKRYIFTQLSYSITGVPSEDKESWALAT